MARFRCLDCGQRSASVIGCTRCGTTAGRQTRHCPVHGATCRPAPGCRPCRTVHRSHLDA